MSFGFGVGDFIAVSDLTLKLYKAFKNAPDEFLEISRELESFYVVIADLREQAKDPESLLNRYGTTKRSELIMLRDNLISTMRELQELHEKYRRMGRISWSRVSLGTTDLGMMRSKLTIQISALNTFMGSLNMATLSRMEPMLERILHFLDGRVKRDLEVAQTVLSVRRNGDEDAGASWAMLEMELRTEGIPSEYICENREQILEVLESIIELNLLEGDDGETIYADDSISQVGRHQRRHQENSVEGSLKAPPKVLTPLKQRPKLVRHWSSKLKVAMRGAPSIDKIRPELTKSRRLPYRDWVSQLSLEEERTRIMLMNQGFDIRVIESEIASSNKLSLFKGGSKSGIVSERAICWAVLNDEELAVRMLLARGCNPSSRYEGMDIAVLAAEAGNWDIVTLLVKSGADIYAGYNTELVRLDRVNKRWVPRGSYIGELQFSSSEERHFLGERGLIHIAAASNRCDIITLLLDSGTHVDICMKSSEEDFTPLRNLNMRECLSWSALQIAAQKHSFEAVELLLKRGAHVHKRTYEGDNVLKFAVMGKKTEKRMDIVRLLLRYGADVNALDKSGCPLLVCATNLRLDDDRKIVVTTKEEKKRDFNLVQLLLDKGAKINVPDKRGRNPLIAATEEAVQGENLNIVRLLLEAGANVNASHGYRITPLQIATRAENEDLIELLLRKGAEISFQTRRGRIPQIFS